MCFQSRDGSRLKLWLGTHGQQQPAAAAAVPAAAAAAEPTAAAAVAMPVSASAAAVGSGVMMGGSGATMGLTAIGIGTGIAHFEPLCLAASTLMYTLYALVIAKHFNSQMLGALTEYVVLHKDILAHKLTGLAYSETRERILRGLHKQMDIACQLITKASKGGVWASVNNFFNSRFLEKQI